MKIWLLIVLMGTSTISLGAQSLDMEVLEAELVQEFETYRNSKYETRYDTLRSKLRVNIERVLSKAQSFDYTFEKLSERINIIQSQDKKVRLFSWDELTGGTWHDMAVIVQYKTEDKTIKTEWIDSDISENPTGLTDAIQYEIHDLEINGKPHYMCFGWGTFGAGHHHKSILIFSIDKDGINHCDNCIPKDYTLLQVQRAIPIKIEYNTEEKKISFDEFKYNDDIGFYEPTGQRIQLKLKNGKFEKL